MSAAKISGVIPCFNQGEFVLDAIESLLAQTHSISEIIIVNDGSTDQATNDLLRNLKRDRVRVFEKENGHLSSARNFGIYKVESEYVILLDADDTFANTFAEKAVRMFRNDVKIGAVTPYFKKFGSDQGIVKTRGGELKDFLTANRSCGNGMIKKSVWDKVGGYDEKMKKGFEDWEFWIRILSHGYSIEILEEPLFNYRVKTISMATESYSHFDENMRYIVT